MVSQGHVLFADMTDSINFDVLNTTQPDFPFDNEVLFITTGTTTTTTTAPNSVVRIDMMSLAGDQQADADVRHAFESAGANANNMNTDAIPNVSDLGLDAMGVGLNNTIFSTLVGNAFILDVFHL